MNGRVFFFAHNQSLGHNLKHENGSKDISDRKNHHHHHIVKDSFNIAFLIEHLQGQFDRKLFAVIIYVLIMVLSSDKKTGQSNNTYFPMQNSSNGKHFIG